MYILQYIQPTAQNLSRVVICQADIKSLTERLRYLVLSSLQERW